MREIGEFIDGGVMPSRQACTFAEVLQKVSEHEEDSSLSPAPTAPSFHIHPPRHVLTFCIPPKFPSLC